MIISSQRYINNEILNEKIEKLESENPAEVVLQTWHVGIDDLEILFNGHHTLEAARQCNIPVRFESTEHPERLEASLKAIPLRRVGTPEDMAGAALFLASPLASYITGQTIIVDGGLTLS